MAYFLWGPQPLHSTEPVPNESTRCLRCDTLDMLSIKSPLSRKPYGSRTHRLACLYDKIFESSDSLEQWGQGTEQETRDSGFPGPSVIREEITYKLRVKSMQ